MPNFAEHPEWQHLMDSLRAAPASRRMSSLFRKPGERLVEHPDEMNALPGMLLVAKGDAVGITTALTGSGGKCKTTLSSALRSESISG